MEIIIPVFSGALTLMTPILFAAAGGVFPALAGTLNIALEGFLLTGAFFAFTVFYYSGSIFAAAAAASLSAAVLSLIHALTVFKLRANIYIAGLAINLFAGGLCVVLSDKIFNTKGVVSSDNTSGILKWYLFIGLFLLLITWIFLNKTPLGYRLRACDKSSEALKSLGINPKVYRICAFLICGLFCGIGGSFLSLNLGAYVPGMSAGKGWIALVIIFLGAKKPFGVLAAAFIFSSLESFSNFAQGFWNLPPDFILAFPYFCTLIAIIVVSIYSKNN
jgi:simple sugar transport system permease protein